MAFSSIMRDLGNNKCSLNVLNLDITYFEKTSKGFFQNMEAYRVYSSNNLMSSKRRVLLGC